MYVCVCVCRRVLVSKICFCCTSLVCVGLELDCVHAIEGMICSDTQHVMHIQGVPGGMCHTSGECSLGQTIPI